MKKIKLLLLTSFSLILLTSLNINKKGKSVVDKEAFIQSKAERNHLNVDEIKPDFILSHIERYYESMIKDSNLCWAACMEALINAYGRTSEIGKDQCEIADFYNQNFVRETVNTGTISEDDCPNIDHISMKDEHYDEMFDRAGFNIDKLAPSDLTNFDQIKISLESNSPIILRSLENEVSHILLIIGYRNRLYYVMDPDSDSRRFYYWSPSRIDRKYSIEKAWKISIN